jgi:transketolase
MTTYKTLETRAKLLRKEIINLAENSGISHYGGSLSLVEVLVLLYKKILTDNDKIIISKGHGILGLYPLLREKGLNPSIKAHPDLDEKNGIFATTGSLGHGLPIAVGMAFARKLKHQKGNIFVVLGDGEIQEGTTWESLNLARKFKLDNLYVIIDSNKLQALDSVEVILAETNIKEKTTAFGAVTIEVNGHDFSELLNGFKSLDEYKNQPKVLIADTIKGKGISFMENDSKWHTRNMTSDELKIAYEELR